MSGPDQMDCQREQLCQLDLDKFRNQRLEQFRGARWPPASRLTSAFWQPYQLALVKLDQQGSGRHVLESPRGVAPVPLLGQSPGKPPPAPPRIGLDQTRD